MATNDHRPVSAPLNGLPKRTALLPLLLLLAFSRSAAQNSAARHVAANERPYKSNVSPTLAILLVVLISVFFLLGFFTVYFSWCTGSRSAVTPAENVGIEAGRSRSEDPRGLDPALLRIFPTMVYSDVKEHKLGKESLECAVCLCEFDDEDILRLLTRCSHVFHLDCIDVWLATHVTCPVCRFDLAASAHDTLPEIENPAIEVLGEETGNEDREVDLADLVRIGSQRRERSGSIRGIPLSSRSRGDWASIVSGGDGRFRLQLPEDMKQEFLEAERLQRSASFGVFLGRSEGNSWRGAGDGRGRGWRSLRLAHSAQWSILWKSRSTGGREAAYERSVSRSSKDGVIVSDKELLDRLDGGGSATQGGRRVKPDDGDASTTGYSQV